MAQRTFEATIKLPHGYEKVRIQASDSFKAKELLEMQYGVGKVTNLTEK